MSKFAAISTALVGAFVAAQLVRPEPARALSDPGRAIQAHDRASRDLVAVLDRACGDCHSNAPVRASWYTQIAPLSWLMAHEVAAGRKAVNFSEWAGYTPEEQRSLLAASCRAARSGRMPGPYPAFKPETRLSAQDVQTICDAAF